MKNVTIALDESMLEASRVYAKTHNTTLNNLIRSLLATTLQTKNASWINHTFKLMDEAKPVNKRKKKWTRDELYDV